jgi:predicted cobalt transporter CbtA
MVQRLIGRGVLAGGVAGALAFLFTRIFAEPQIQKAIKYESAREAAQQLLDKAAGLPLGAAGPDIFSRGMQANVGASVGMIAFGAAMGAVFAVVYAVCLGRVGNLKPRSISLLVATGGFLAIYLVPFIKYPATPPSIGHADTVKERGALYLLMVFFSVVFLILAVILGKRLKARFGNWNASLIAGAAFVLAVGILMVILPQFGHLHSNVALYGRHATETPLPLTDGNGKIVFAGFPADVMWDFRVYSLAAQMILWATIGLVFAPLADRLLGRVGGHESVEPTTALV